MIKLLPVFIKKLPIRVILAAIPLIGALIAAIAAPLLSLHSPLSADLMVRLIPPVFQSGGTWDHILGTDHLGRDILSRIIYGSRVSLSVGFISTLLGSVIGGILGLISGYFRGKIDGLITKLIDIQLSFPFILFAIFVISITGPQLRNIIIVCGVTSWVTYARVVRGQVLSIREQEFIEAARGIGCSFKRIIFRHVFPNIFSSLIVVATLDIGRIIVLESTLSFLGLGVQPPIPSWGGILFDGKVYMLQAWWIITLPGLTIMAVVLSANILGDYFSDLMDPHTKQLMGAIQKQQ
jgi:peptide/nickel transport system permease protein